MGCLILNPHTLMPWPLLMQLWDQQGKDTGLRTPHGMSRANIPFSVRLGALCLSPSACPKRKQSVVIAVSQHRGRGLLSLLQNQVLFPRHGLNLTG